MTNRNPGSRRGQIASFLFLASTMTVTWPVGAQEADPTRVVSTRRAMPAWLGGSLSFHVAPRVRFRAGGLFGDASALVGGGRQEPRRLEGEIAAAFGLPTVSAFRFETEIGAFRTRLGPDIRAHGLEGAVRLLRQDAGGMLWIGGSLASAWDEETNRQARTMMGGVWKVLGSSGMGLSVRMVEYDEDIVLGRDTTYEVLGFPFTSRRTEQFVYDHYYVDAELIASHRVGPVALHLEGGGRLTRRSVRERRTWARGGIEFPVLREVTLQIAAGQRPNQPEYRIEAGSFASIGVQLELGKRAWEDPFRVPDIRLDAPTAELRPVDDHDAWELVIRNVPGRRVEIMGDPTDWQPRSLDSVSHTAWRTVLHLPPGTYHVNMRIDSGSWRELPGYPSTRDEFGGLVGVIVIEGNRASPNRG
jgi:hypothetical protein